MVRLLCACAAALSLFVTMSMQAQPPAGVAAGAKKKLPPPPEAARVLSLAGDTPIVIAEPGYYRLDRNWFLDDMGSQEAVLRVTANNVTLDFRGYVIETSTESIAITVGGHGFTLRNGTLRSLDDQGYALNIQGSGATIENMRVSSNQQASVLGSPDNSGIVVRDSEFIWGVCCSPPGSVLERNFFFCPLGCGGISDGTRFVDNVIDSSDGVGLGVTGDGSVIERNTFRQSTRTTIVVDGRNNVVKDNTVQVGGSPEPVVQVNNGANVFEENVLVPAMPGARATVGIRFTADGNFYGNNRLAALVPVDLGATTQTDWGGNGGF
jgi:hypothetical protein